MNIYNNSNEIQEESVANGLQYIYVIENYPQHNIKIGKSTNVKQRFNSLSGSNSGGNKLIRVAVSPATYLYTIEKNAHNHFNYARIQGTEWFDGNKVTFEEVIDYLDNVFNSHNYTRLNEERGKHVLSKLLSAI